MKNYGVLSVLASLFLWGCGDYQLVVIDSRLGGAVDDLTWESRAGSTAPPSRIEQLVIDTAQNHQEITDGKTRIAYVASFSKYTLVAAYEVPDECSDLFAAKKVMRYLVVAGQIHALLGPTYEPFPDLVFEKSVNICARNAMVDGGSSTLQMLGWIKPVMLKGTVTSKCSVAVNAYLAREGGPGDKLGEKLIRTCIPE
jgi:hypothetical protein